MLRELSVEGFALIDRLKLVFGKGLSVVTGETGAGKSIIIDALGLLLGARASSDMLRTGAKTAIVEGSFGYTEKVCSLLDEWGVAMDTDEVIVSREIHRNGRNRCRVNGRMVTVQQLGVLGPLFVDIIGQHDQHSLFDATTHQTLLDHFGDQTHKGLLSKVADCAQRYKDALTRRQAIEKNEGERLRQIDLLRFQIKEITQASLHPGEEEVLAEERDKLAHAERLQSVCATVYNSLQEDVGDRAGLLHQLTSVVSELDTVSRFDQELGSVSQLINSSLVSLEEATRDLRHLMETYEADPARLEDIEQRLRLLEDLKRKYGGSVREVVRYLQDSQQELADLEASEASAADLAAEEQRWYQAWKTAAQELSTLRRQCASALEQRVEKELAELNMSKTRFVVDFQVRDQVELTGLDTIEFLISPNPGEELRPLARIASGGEASRILLALKTILNEYDRKPTLVFDEADTGIGGKTAQKIGVQLQQLSTRCQVLTVTHLPIVASYAHHHVRVEKQEVNGRTTITVKPLDEEERVSELARMLGGDPEEGIPSEHARELLRKHCTM